MFFIIFLQADQAQVPADEESDKDSDAAEEAVRLQELVLANLIDEKRRRLARGMAEKEDELNQAQAVEILKQAEADLVR